MNDLMCYCQIMVSGVSKINVEDWRRHTRLKACNAKTPVVQWFWRAVTQSLCLYFRRAVAQFDDERRARLLQFVTGSFRVPVHGFKALRGKSSLNNKFSSIADDRPIYVQ